MKVAEKEKMNVGFTLIEVLIVVAILLILVTASVAGLQAFSARARHVNAAHVVLGALEEAHARTLASDNDDAYGVYFETNQVTIYQGTSYVSGDPNNDVRILPAQTNIALISLGGGDEVQFERLTGSASPTGSITVVDNGDASASSTIVIYDTGLSEISS